LYFKIFKVFLFSPLEQFQILPLIPIRFGNFDISFTNGNLIIIIALTSFILLIKMMLSSKESFFYSAFSMANSH